MAMNPQEKRKRGELTGRGIEWADFSWNPIGGCFHRCRWRMPDGKIAICYAEAVTRKFSDPWPDGFEHHYFRENILKDPWKYPDPARIFMDSMSDLMGAWVPKEQIDLILDTCRLDHWHTFILLTKNAPRLKEFDFPSNVWTLVSSPPDFMRGKELTRNQQEKMLAKSLKALSETNSTVKGMSFEPLSWDVSSIIARYPVSYPALDWAIIGAASNGNKYYQPEPEHILNLLAVLDAKKVPVFFKGNLWGNGGIICPHGWREYFPGFKKSKYMGMRLGKGAMPI